VADSWRPAISLALAILTALLLAGAGIAGYTRGQLVDQQQFSIRVTSSLEDDDVRAIVSQRVVDALVESASEDFLSVRPLLTSAVDALVGTDAFQRVFRLAVADAHGALVQGRGSLILDLDRGMAVLLDGLRSVSPRLARDIPADVEPQLAGLEPDAAELSAGRKLTDIAGWWWTLAVGFLLTAAGCLATATDRRRALGRLGAAAAASGVAVAGLVTVLGLVIVSRLSGAADLEGSPEREALAAVWTALFGDLRSSSLLFALAGTAVAAVASGALAPEQLSRGLTRARAAASSTRRPVQLARGLALLGVGGLILADAGTALQVAILAVGGLLIFIGVAELARSLEPRAVPSHAPRSRAPLVAAGAVVAVGALTVGLVSVVISPPKVQPAAASRPGDGCNGSKTLCDRRLNEVVFPATHNSFSAAQRPGWLFANQRYPISRQLEDGIRGFMLDVHYGARDPQTGRVRTDLEGEEKSRNRVARELSPRALATADRLVGRVGLGTLAGSRGLYLCHTLCELGSEPLDEQLGVLRRFLDAHPAEVLLLFIEPYVPPEQIELAFRRAGLLEQLAGLDREEPLPTLGELVERDTRLVVFTESGGGTRPWYLPGFSFVRDTPLGAQGPSDLTCARNRGDADSPMLLVNHWIDDFPPPPSRNSRIGGDFLRERLERCERERGTLPNLVAVDFYERSGVVAAARALNARP
jgi:uncharacterized membrane protein HdeD (DUF308 family)